ncbi:MAG: manganese efflux pump [Clostridiales bacterium]|nr:manganese efflux pump [Clostridiales bacterium]
MHFSELLFLAVALSMDALAVSVCKGMAQKQNSFKNMVLAGTFFGGFQALMPLLGYLLAFGFKEHIIAIDHWIAFGLLLALGLKMIHDSRKGECALEEKPFDFKVMLLMAVATSIDALAVGVTFAFLDVNIFLAASLIGLVTFIISALGVGLGYLFGNKLNSKAELLGGLILIVMGSKILFEHLRAETIL